MKNNKITMKMAQERVNELHGEYAFWITEWNGSKKAAKIMFGEYNPVEITISRGEYLYRSDRRKYLKNIIKNMVQFHLDDQEKDMTLIAINGEKEPAIAICHTCGEELFFRNGYKITSNRNTCIRCKQQKKDSMEFLKNELMIQGINASGREEELKSLLSELESRQEILESDINSYNISTKNVARRIEANRSDIQKKGIHQYFLEEYLSQFECDEEYLIDSEHMLCA